MAEDNSTLRNIVTEVDTSPTAGIEQQYMQEYPNLRLLMFASSFLENGICEAKLQIIQQISKTFLAIKRVQRTRYLAARRVDCVY